MKYPPRKYTEQMIIKSNYLKGEIMNQPKLIHKWKDYKIYSTEGNYQIIWHGQLIIEGDSDTVKDKLNKIIDLHYERNQSRQNEGDIRVNETDKIVL